MAKKTTDARETKGWLKNVVIVGADESDEIGMVPHKGVLQLHSEAALNALEDAGIDKREVDGILTCGAGWSGSLQIAEYLGIEPRYTDSTAVGGS